MKTVIKNGKIVDDRRLYYKNDRLKKEDVYVDEKLVKELIYDKNGNIKNTVDKTNK
jgi:antitoxin component YwqK of YwqJK toxin-antitoxin module